MTNTIKKFTAYDAAVMARISYEESDMISFFGGTSKLINIPSSDTQILCCSFEISGRKINALVFSGTKSFRDILTDANLFCKCEYMGGKVHPGVLMAWETARLQVLDFLSSEDATDTFLIGHSLGGQLTAPAEEDIFHMMDRTCTRVTFGAPPFGNTASCAHRNGHQHLKHHRYVSGLDFAACSWIHALLGYRHDTPAIKIGGWRRYGSHHMKNYENLLKHEDLPCLLP